MKNQHRSAFLLPLVFASLFLLPFSSAWAQVKVSQATPASAAQGTLALDVTIDGSGFDASSTVAFLVSGSTDTGGIVVRKVQYKSSKQLVATIDVADTATLGGFDVKVTLASGRNGKGTTLFSVQSKSGGSTDPCIGAQARGFPSFAFTKPVGTAWGIFVADATAQCQRQVGLYPYSRTVNFRYDPATLTGVIVHDADARSLAAAAISVAFSADGSPAVQASAFQTLISVAGLPDPQLAGWGPLKYIAVPVVSPDGGAILFLGDTEAGGDDRIFWACALNSVDVTVDPLTCSVVHRAPSTGMGATATWGARQGTIYLTQTATSGSGGSLYRLTLPTSESPNGSFEEIWSRGTEFTYAKATLASGVERVAVYEPDVTTGNLCSTAWVIDADSCSGNSCSVLNGQGNPARSVGWLPDGRVLAEGQTAPSRRGKCSPAGTVVSFEATDLTGTATTLTKGVYPEGAGGG